MDFALNEDQLELQEMVREFVNKEITPFAGEMDRNNEAMPGLMEKAADMAKAVPVLPLPWRQILWRLILFC
jgi:alkylation response protein AidB-like acyl-CoA dehydrogenase